MTVTAQPNSPLVSVLMPTYNRSALLKLAIESVLAQTFTDYELLIVDNCSTDDTASVVGGFADSRIVYHRHDRNVGAVLNYNRALRLAKGKYIYTFSDDDLMWPENLAKKVAVLEEHPNVGLVHSSINTINVDGEETWGHWATLHKEWDLVISEPVMKRPINFNTLYYNWIYISMPTVMFRRQLVEEHRLEFNNQLKYLVDWDLWLKLAMYCDFYCINEALVSYRRHSNNESGILNLSAQIHFAELMISKMSLYTLLGKESDGAEQEYAKAHKATLAQIKWLKPDNKLLRPVKNLVKAITRK